MASLAAGASLRFIRTNGIRMRIAEMGSGPLVMLAHGWPDNWRSWRHQLRALADAGFHAVALEMRGYGETDAPGAVEAYDLDHLAGDIVGAADALGHDRFHLVGHDWGSMAAAGTAQRHPERLASLTLMSVPHLPRPPRRPLEIFAELFGDNFFYILYHNEPGGVAEAEYDADPEGLLRRLFASPDTPRAEPEVTDPHRAAGGWIPRLGLPDAPPPWLPPEDFEAIVGDFRRAGFRGGVNYYRNFDRNWERAGDFVDTRLPMPVLFVAGAQDMVVLGRTADDLRAAMSETCADLRGVHLIDGVGHWVQQEAPVEVSALLLEFLGPRSGR